MPAVFPSALSVSEIPDFFKEVGDLRWWNLQAGWENYGYLLSTSLMPYRAIAFETGNIYHLYNRGNNRQNIFFERENYLHFLRLVRQYLTPETVEVLAYCLMPNHYHLLVQFQAGSLSAQMKALSLAYTKGMNARYNRVGVLFQGRFCSILVDREAYLVHLARYIHLNPVKAELVKHPKEWEFSSYREYAGLRQGTLPKLERLQVLTGTTDAYQMFLDDQALPQEARVRSLMLDE